jgi:DNA polymerase elongation subunit (family B)
VTGGGPRILTLDIETAPAVVETWSLHNAFISVEQVRQPSTILGFGYKWHDAKRVGWVSSHVEGHEGMVEAARNLLHDADIVVTYNGDAFDIRHLQREILLADLTPPSKVKSVDLYRVVKRRFKFQSNKLAFVADQLGVGQKASTGGYDLWKRCMAGDDAAWRKMAAYCRQDVRVTEALYDRLLPWIPNHPNVALWSAPAGRVCPNCGGSRLQARGEAVTVAAVYQRYQCQGCGAWSRGNSMERRLAGQNRSAV